MWFSSRYSMMGYFTYSPIFPIPLNSHVFWAFLINTACSKASRSSEKSQWHMIWSSNIWAFLFKLCQNPRLGFFGGICKKGQNQFIARLFGLAAQARIRSICLTLPTCLLPGLFATEPAGLVTVDIWMDFPCRQLSCIIKKTWRLSGTDIFCYRTSLYDRK